MKCKVLFIALISIMFASTTSAQSAIGIRAGVNFSNITGKMGGEKIEDSKLIPGFNIGVTYDISLADEFYIQPALLFTTKGAKSKLDLDDSPDVESKMILNYIELPINFLYKPMMGDGHLLLGVGPYVAYGLSGKMKMGDYSGDLKFGKDEDLNAFDYGGNLLFGYQFSNGFSAQLNAQLGMGNLVIDGDKDNKMNNTQFGISLGYKF